MMTSIVLVGLNHRTAGIEMREQVAQQGHSAAALLAAQDDALGEVVVLATCNRLEVYATAATPAQGWEAIEAHLAQGCSAETCAMHDHLYFLADGDTAEHLMRVAAGLDSMILGEPQILGQVAAAFAAAQAGGASGPVLSHLFGQALHSGKRARSETAIGAYTTSLSHAAAQLATAIVGDLADRHVLIVGAGEMAELAAVALAHHGARTFSCINRTQGRAEHLAAQFGGRALSWSQLVDGLTEADVVVSATGAPHTVLSRDDLALAIQRRRATNDRRAILLLDIALPRDIDPAVDELTGVIRYDLDHLQDTVDGNLSRRLAAVPEVEAIVAAEAAAFFDWLQGRQVVPALVELRRRATMLAEDELHRTLRRLNHADRIDSRIEQEMAHLTHRIVAKLLHEPTIRLKAHAATGNGAVYAQVIEDLFALAAEQPVYTPAGVNGTNGINGTNGTNGTNGNKEWNH